MRFKKRYGTPYTPWRLWYAWYPVKVRNRGGLDETVVWLEQVVRRDRYDYYGDRVAQHMLIEDYADMMQKEGE